MDKFSSASKSTLSYKPLNHSIAYVKPHKTGSSTIALMVDRIVYGRGLYKMIPANHSPYLGWPDVFPGNVEGMDTVMQHHKYNAFSSHSVFSNRSHIANYLQQPIALFTILRDPMSRVISAYNYFPQQKQYSHIKAKTWREHIDRGRAIQTLSGWYQFMSWNNLAFSLGWYHQPHINFSTAQDRNVTAIQAFVNKVDAEFDLVMILEDLLPSLVLLKEIVMPELDVTELLWMEYDGGGRLMKGTLGNEAAGNETQQKLYPTEAEKKELKEMLFLDYQIYNHFRDKLHSQWNDATARNNSNSKSIQIRDSLQCTHDALDHFFDDSDVVSNVTKQFYSFRVGQFNRLLLHRQNKKYGYD
jgi:hypothetical protein